MAVLVVLGAIALQPYIERHFYAATVARPIEARGNLADYEQSAIALFERVSPSVVQVVGRSGNGNNRVSPSGD
jgi:2-alkenal reductase